MSQLITALAWAMDSNLLVEYAGLAMILID
jgi:hypothetical protein